MGVSKKCSKCNEIKSIAYFYKQKKGLHERTAECKDCRRKRTKVWSDENREKKNSKNRERYKYIDRREYNKKWRAENPNYFKEYYKQNTEIRLECNRRYFKKHPEIYKAYKKYRNAVANGFLKKSDQC